MGATHCSSAGRRGFVGAGPSVAFCLRGKGSLFAAVFFRLCPWSIPSIALPCLFQDLLDPARWRMLIQQFRYDNYRLHQLGNNSVFTLTLQAGLSAIKTPYPSGGQGCPCAQPSSAWGVWGLLFSSQQAGAAPLPT